MLVNNALAGIAEWIAASKNLKISPLNIGNSDSETVVLSGAKNPGHLEDFTRLVAAAAKKKK